VNYKKWRKWFNFFNIYYLITFKSYLCSQRIPNVQMKSFMFDWTIYTPFVLNRDWKRDSLQMMVFVNVCSTWSMVQLKTCFETWITRNVVNRVSLFHLLYLKTIMAYLCSHWTPYIQMKYSIFNWSMYTIFVLKRDWKRDSLQIMTSVYVCSTWGIVD
jgi:hypothetical protein